MISIILPIYNAEEYLKECLESIINQSYTDFEVLCINDGSKDNSKSICESICDIDKRFHLINQINRGVSASRNVGINLSKGEYICFIDADDVIDNNYLMQLVKHIDGYDSVFHELTSNKNLLGLNKNKSFIYSPKELISLILNMEIKHPAIVCFLFKTENVRQTKKYYIENCYRNEDTEFYINYLSCCKRDIKRIEYNAYYYRPVLSSAMHNISIKSLTSIDATIRMNKMLVEKDILSPDNILTETSVLAFVYFSARNNNKPIYNYLHDKYRIRECAFKVLKHQRLKYKLLAVVYILLKESLFYKLLS